MDANDSVLNKCFGFFCFFLEILFWIMFTVKHSRGKLLLLFNIVKKNKQIESVLLDYCVVEHELCGYTHATFSLKKKATCHLKKALLNNMLSTGTFEHK